MATLRIYAADGAEGDERCYITLISDSGEELLKSEEPTTAEVAGENAKTLKFKGPTGDWQSMETDFGEAFILESISRTYFTISAELTEVRNALGNAKIDWVPPNLNPTAVPAKQITPPAKPWVGS